MLNRNKKDDLVYLVETLRYVARRVELGQATANDAKMIFEIADQFEDGTILWAACDPADISTAKL